MNSNFRKLFGFEHSEVDHSNWRNAPFSRYAFQHVDEYVKTQLIQQATDKGNDCNGGSGGLDTLERKSSLAEFIETSSTDVLLVLKRGARVIEYEALTASATNPHLLFSVSKSITGLLAGILWDEQAVDLLAPVTEYLPEAANSAFKGATIRDLLDMRVSTNADEVYADKLGWGARYCRAVLWDPLGNYGYEPHLQLLLAMPGSGEISPPMRYRSSTTDVLGIVLTRAANTNFADLLRKKLAAPLSFVGRAIVSVDREETAQAAGGICLTASDLLDIGEMMRQGGCNDGKRIVSDTFVNDTLYNGDRNAWQRGDFNKNNQATAYRNQWYVRGDQAETFYAVGIHGQWLYINRRKEVTIAKLSSQPVAYDIQLNRLTLEMFDAISDWV